jgi:hypothetical protein
MLVMDKHYLPMQVGHLIANTLNISNIWSTFLTDMTPSTRIGPLKPLEEGGMNYFAPKAAY